MAISVYGSCKYHDVVAKQPTVQLLTLFSPSLEPCRLPPPLHTIIVGYLLHDELGCMTISQIEAGGDKAAALAMGYLKRCNVLQDHPGAAFSAGFKYVSLCSNDVSYKLWDTTGKSDLEIIQTVCLDAWRMTLYFKVSDRALDRSLCAATPKTFKDRICFHSITLNPEHVPLPHVDPSAKETLKKQLQDEQTDVAREIVAASKKKQ